MIDAVEFSRFTFQERGNVATQANARLNICGSLNSFPLLKVIWPTPVRLSARTIGFFTQAPGVTGVEQRSRRIQNSHIRNTRINDRTEKVVEVPRRIRLWLKRGLVQNNGIG